MDYSGGVGVKDVARVGNVIKVKVWLQGVKHRVGDVNGVVDGVVSYGVVFGDDQLVGVTPYVESQSS